MNIVASHQPYHLLSHVCYSLQFVPLIVEHCCDVVERKGLETVGVYR